MTYVRKLLDNSVQVYALGETVVLADGTKIPYGNLDSYSSDTLAAFSLFRFSDPVAPVGKRLVNVSYIASANGVDQVPVFVDQVPGPLAVLANMAASASYTASLRRRARHYAAVGNTAKSVSLFLKAAGVPS